MSVLTTEQINALRQEFLTDPLNFDYMELIPDKPGHIVNILNAKTQMMVRERFVTARTLLANMNPMVAASILEKLEAVGPSNPVVKWGLRFLTSDPGIDVGHPNTRGLFTALRQANIFTLEEHDALMALANLPASRAEVLFGANLMMDEKSVLLAMAGI